MKILHLIVSLENGGAERMLVRLIDALPDHDHVVVSLTEVGPIGEQLAASGRRVFSLCMNSGGVLRGLLNLWRLLRELRPHVLQTWMYHSDLIGGILGRLAGVPSIIWNVRNTEIPQGTLSKTAFMIRACALASYFLPSHIVCCGDSVAQRHASLGYKNSRLCVIHNGYPVGKWSPPEQDKATVRASLNFPKDEFIIGCFGRFDALKDYGNVLSAAAMLQQSADLKILILFAGQGMEAGNHALQRMIKHHKGLPAMRLLGHRDDIAHVMYCCDVLCMSSKAEGFPNVVAESMLLEVPCVVTDVGDARLIVGDTGLVVPPQEPKLLAAGMAKFTEMTQVERKELGKAARQRIELYFSIDDAAKKYDRLYKQ